MQEGMSEGQGSSGEDGEKGEKESRVIMATKAKERR